MNQWISVDEQPPPLDVLIQVKAWEFGCSPITAHVWASQSSLPEQPIQYRFDRELYGLERDWFLADQVRYWRHIENE